MIDLATIVLTESIKFGYGQILKALIECPSCGDKKTDSIGNKQFNTLGCKNCWNEVVQFTNACSFTDNNNLIGQVGAKLFPNYYIETDPLSSGFFSKKYPDWIFFPMSIRAKNLIGKQIIVTGFLSDFETGEIYSKKEDVYYSPYEDSRWYDKNRLPIRWTDIPLDLRNDRLFKVSLKIRSVSNDIIYESDKKQEQIVVKLWP